MPQVALKVDSSAHLFKFNTKDVYYPEVRVSLSDLWGNTAFWHGSVPMKVYARAPDTAVAKGFVERMLSMTPQGFASHGSSRELAGQGAAPQRVASADALAEPVKTLPGAIGYMMASEAWANTPAGVRVIEVD